MMTVQAPAKVNLVLEVLRRTGDYHEISSILQTISLYDTLTFQSSDEVAFTCSQPTLMKDNLVERAARLLRKTCGTQRGVNIHLEKRIPTAAGLGGGSSDAAATLTALNQFWQLGLTEHQLIEAARTLGSDVPALLHGGTVHMTGRGDMVVPAPPLSKTHIVILLPSVQVPNAKTASLYGNLRPEMFTSGRYVAEALRSLAYCGTVPESLMFNVFEQVQQSCFPGIDTARDELAAASGSTVHLTGSGPALFTLAETSGEASRVVSRLAASGHTVFATESLP